MDMQPADMRSCELRQKRSGLCSQRTGGFVSGGGSGICAAMVRTPVEKKKGLYIMALHTQRTQLGREHADDPSTQAAHACVPLLACICWALEEEHSGGGGGDAAKGHVHDERKRRHTLQDKLDLYRFGLDSRGLLSVKRSESSCAILLQHVDHSPATCRSLLPSTSCVCSHIRGASTGTSTAVVVKSTDINPCW